MENHRPAKQQAACGTWVSPLTAEDATGSIVGLGSLAADDKTLYWLEARPSEKGRTVLVRRTATGVVEDITPPPVNVASRVHEYGGGAYAVSDNKIVYSEKSDGSVWLIEGDEVPRKIVAATDCRYADFSFVPHTDKIICVREDHRNRKPTDPESTIVLLDTDKSINPAANEGGILAKGADFYSSPRPTPDGKKITWLTWNHPDMPWDATQLHRADFSPTGGLSNEKIIAGDTQREAIVQPQWAADGTLYFCTDRNNWWNIHRCNNVGDIEAVTARTDGEIGGPHWVFGEKYFAFMPDGKIIAALSKDGQTRAVTIDNGAVTNLNLPSIGQCPVLLDGAHIAVLSTAGDAQSAILLHSTDTNVPDKMLRSAGAPLLEKKDISMAQEITFPTAGGEEAHAFYYPPANGSFEPKPNEKPPLVVMIHGGPTAAARTGFSAQKQWWTTRGFAVVDVNYRGSTGYGRAYRQKLNGNWGVADVEDCMAAVNYLVAHGKADPDRVAIRGGSAGGFTALAALTTSDVFKAGASLYGVGDLMLLAAETHKFEARYLDRLIGPLPQEEAVYHERSPINHLDKLKAGVIFFQGLDDKVVPPSQAQKMVKAMHDRNLPVEHFEFAGEGHGFRQAETQRRVLELELDFYAKIFGFTAPKAKPDAAPKNDKPAKTVNNKR